MSHITILYLIVAAIAALVGVCVLMTCKTWVEIKSLKNSTHQITYYNPEADFQKLSQDLKDQADLRDTAEQINMEHL